MRGVALKPIKNWFSKKTHSGPRILKELIFLFYVIYNAKSMDILMRFHLSEETILIGLFYKWLNPEGFLYIKADGGKDFCNNDFSLKTHNPIKLIKRILKRRFYSQFLNAVDLITFETEPVYRQFKYANILGVDLGKKSRLLHNGFDKEQFEKFNFAINEFSEKENLIITVGRLGSRQKNTELLLQAAQGLDLKDWNITLIGPLEKDDCDFQKTMDMFFAEKPLLRKKITFTGPIYDKKELWKWYNRAKVFVLSSRWESFAIVLTEAFVFQNYIISTDVGVAGEMLISGGDIYGEIVPQDNVSFLQKTLQRVINENRLEVLYKKTDWEKTDISWERCIREVFNEYIRS
jgi:glycosyltransferase involved in cell wall biosynthesis